MNQTSPSAGREVDLAEDDIIVSKTDLGGRITYANRTFMRIANYSEAELLGQPHRLIRHPDMPRVLFRRMWASIGSGEEFFCFLKNRTADGGHYWVFASVCPDLAADGTQTGYFSVRRRAAGAAIEQVLPLYRGLLDAERRGGMEAADRLLDERLGTAPDAWNRYMLGCYRQALEAEA